MKRIYKGGVMAGTGLVFSLLLTSPVWASPSVIEEVKVHGTAQSLRIDLHADGAIAADGVRVKVDEGVVYLYVRDTRVHSDRRSWSTEEGAVKAHRHRTETELVVPTGARACAADASFETSQTGLSALLTCSSTGAQAGKAASTLTPSALKPRLAARHAEPEAAERPLDEVAAQAPSPAKHAAALAVPSVPASAAPDVQERAALAALVALPAEGTITHKAAAAADEIAPALAKVASPPVPPLAATVNKAPQASVAPVAPAPTVASATASAAAAKSPAVASNSSPASTSTSASASTPVPASAPTPASASTPASSSGSLMGPLVGVLVLIGGGAFWWKKKRGLALPRRIQIMETASLGPKRSLVVAEVDGERLILASSEAGITLLRSDPLNDRTEGLGQPMRVTREESAFSVAASAATAAMSAASTSTSTSASGSNPPSAAAMALFRASSREGAPGPVTENTQASAAVSEAASALFSRPSDHNDEPTELEGAASGLSRLRSLSGGLSQVFRSQEAKAAAKAEAKAEPAPERSLEDDWFVDVLDDSVEDQELRAKLAQGIGGRVT